MAVCSIAGIPTRVREWLDHFDSVAKINGWETDEAVKWLSVRLVGCVKAVYKRLPNKTGDHFVKVREAVGSNPRASVASTQR